MQRKSWLWSLVTVLIIATGCADDGIGGPSDDTEGIVDGTTPARVHIDPDGTVWQLRGKATFGSYADMLERRRERLYEELRNKDQTQRLDDAAFDRAVEAIEYGAFPISEEEAAASAERPEMTVERLAEDLRGVTLIGDYEYISDPDYDRAARLLSIRGTGGMAFESSHDEVVEAAGPVNKIKCCGTDNRFQTTVYTDYARILLSEVGGTIGIISSNVGVTAAHVLYDTEANAWLKVDRDGDGLDDWPKFRRETSVNDTTPQTLSCARLTVPGCWISATSNGSITCDYAPVDFSVGGSGNPCSDTTPFDTWNGAWIRTEAQIEAAQNWGLGYPGFVHESGGNVNGPGLTFQYTRLNSTWGSLTFIDGVPMFAPPQAPNTNWVYDVQIRNKNDATPGDSGRPFLQSINSSHYMIGHNVGNLADGSYTIDRWFDDDVWSFIQAYSPL